MIKRWLKVPGARKGLFPLTIPDHNLTEEVRARIQVGTWRQALLLLHTGLLLFRDSKHSLVQQKTWRTLVDDCWDLFCLFVLTSGCVCKSMGGGRETRLLGITFWILTHSVRLWLARLPLMECGNDVLGRDKIWTQTEIRHGEFPKSTGKVFRAISVLETLYKTALSLESGFEGFLLLVGC